MPKCAVKKCKSNTLTTRKKDGVSYFRFPKNEIEREKWRTIIAAERGENGYKPNNSSVICSYHFHESDMYTTKTGLKRIKKHILPRIEIDQTTASPEIAVLTNSIVYLHESTISTNIVKTESLDPLQDSEYRSGSVSTEPNKSTDMYSQQRQVNLPKKLKKTNGENEYKPPPANNAPNKNNRRTPSATSIKLTSIFDADIYKKELEICKKKLVFKNKHIHYLKKKTRRLLQRNNILKEAVKDLKKNMGIAKGGRGQKPRLDIKKNP